MSVTRILVVDDNRDAADSLSMVLRLWGYEPLVAYNGRDALATARREKPDVVLLDLIMPGLNGIELVHQLRQEPETARSMLVCISGMSDEKSRCALADAGCDHFLLKASEINELQSILASHLALA